MFKKKKHNNKNRQTSKQKNGAVLTLIIGSCFFFRPDTRLHISILLIQNNHLVLIRFSKIKTFSPCCRFLVGKQDNNFKIIEKKKNRRIFDPYCFIKNLQKLYESLSSPLTAIPNGLHSQNMKHCINNYTIFCFITHIDRHSSQKRDGRLN